MNGWKKDRMNEWMKKWMSEGIKEWITESMDESTNESINELMKEGWDEQINKMKVCKNRGDPYLTGCAKKFVLAIKSTEKVFWFGEILLTW